MCFLVSLLLHHTRTYGGRRHSDAHCCEHGVGHCAALIGQPDAVVTAEESSPVRWQRRLVQKHGNQHHCMVGHTTRADTNISEEKRVIKIQNVIFLHHHFYLKY